MLKRCLFKINNQPFNILVQSKKFINPNKNKFLFDTNLFKNEEFLENGYFLTDFPFEWSNSIKKNIKNYIFQFINNKENIKNFDLNYYHNYVDDYNHNFIINKIRGGNLGLGGIDLNLLGVKTKDFDDFINEQIQSNFKLSCIFNFYGFKNKKFWIRIIRPNRKDNNPPHKDSHLRSFWIKDNVNIYLPIAGSNQKSSLPILPKSHLDNENQYTISSSPCYVNGNRYTVPCIVERDGDIDMITPNPNEKQILIFTPHIVHGGGMNLNEDLTRISLEMRFFK
jgi:hypothetical protein